ADPLALEFARAPYPGTADHGRELAVDEDADSHQILSAFTRQTEVVDIQHREVRAAGREQLQRVRRRARYADLDLHRSSRRRVEGGREDRSVRRVGSEV